MEIFGFINNFLASRESAFVLGILGAFTPCTMAIFPIFLYRFGLWEGKPDLSKRDLLNKLVGFGLAAIGFLLSFAAAGFIIQTVVASDFANILRLVLATALVIIGIVVMFGHINLQTTFEFTNPFLVGAGLPWILSFSPCVLAFTATLVVGSGISTGAAVLTLADRLGASLNFFLFGLGMLVPVALMLIGGNTFLGLVRKSNKLFYLFEKLSPSLLILAGIYLGTQLVQINSLHVVIAGIVVLTFLYGGSYYILRKGSLSGLNRFVLLSISLISAVGIVIARNIALPYNNVAPICGIDGHVTSPAGLPIGLVFTLIGLMFAGWYLNRHRLNKIKLSLGLTS